LGYRSGFSEGEIFWDNYICSRNVVFNGKNGSKIEFHRNGLLATLGSSFQEGQN
jgi:hypothetical protein